MGYPGGKAGAGVYQRIINEIPPHAVYVEPFLGDGAILRRKRPAQRSIGVEISPGAAAAFAASARAEGRGDVEVHCCCGIDWLRHQFGLYRVPADPAAPDRAAAAGAARSGGRRPPNPAAAAAAALSGGVGLGWFVYCDPPYLLSTRRSGRIYEHELTDAQHAELLEVLVRLPCPVAVSGYWSPLYAAALQGWRSISFNAVTRGGRLAKEFLWMNYPAPTALHDYRFLGGNKRQRERVARKVRTWSAGLARLPRLERQAIVDGIILGER